MTAQSSITAEVALSTTRAEWPLAELVRWAAAGLLGLLVLAAVVLGWRRLDAGLSQPLGLLGLAAVAVGVVGLGAASRLAWRRARPAKVAGPVDVAVAGMISAALVAMAAAVSLPGTSPAGLALLWGILATEELWAWLPRPTADGVLRFRLPTLRRKRRVRVDPREPSTPPPVSGFVRQPPEQDVLQQLTRSRSADGGEAVSGWLRVPLAAGQRIASVHVAFCPPLARTPNATVEQIDGPRARVKTVQLLPYGARFDLKLAAPSEVAETLLLEFSAVSEPPQSAEG